MCILSCLVVLTGCDYADEFFMVTENHFVPNEEWIRSSPHMDTLLGDSVTDMEGHYANRDTSFTEFSYSSELSVSDEFDRAAATLERYDGLTLSHLAENQVRFELERSHPFRENYITLTYQQDTGRYVVVFEYGGTMTGGYIAGRPIGPTGSRGLQHVFERQLNGQ